MNRKHAMLAYVALVAATPVAMWWLLPDMSEKGGSDYMLEPLDMPGAVRWTIGLGASALVVGSVALVLSPAGRALRRPADTPVVVPLVLAGAYAGVTYRVATAAVGGANIGGGIMVLVGMVLVPTLVLYSCISAAVAARRRRWPAQTSAKSSTLDWRLVSPIGFVSIVTMPITAIWFLLLALLAFVGTTVAMALTRRPARATDIFRTGLSIGVGLLPGPAAYLALAALV